MVVSPIPRYGLMQHWFEEEALYPMLIFKDKVNLVPIFATINMHLQSSHILPFDMELQNNA